MSEVKKKKNASWAGGGEYEKMQRLSKILLNWCEILQNERKKRSVDARVADA